MHHLKRAGALCVLAGLLFVAIALQYDPVAGTPIVSGSGYDDGATLLAANGRLLVVFERLVSNHNDLYFLSSEDEGATWSDPIPISTGSADDRVGSLVQLNDGTLALFYTSNVGGVYQIHRATSNNGSTWTLHGAIDLHQLPASPINPHVLAEEDGRLTLVYQLLAGGIFVAQSADSGVTWDEEPTSIGPPSAVSPHITHTSDGRYLLTYHQGSANLGLYAKLSDDPYVWEGDPIPISVGQDSRDGFPLLLDDGTLAVFYSLSVEEAPADIYYQASEDGSTWDTPVQVTEAEGDEMMPVAVPASTTRGVDLIWSQETDAGADFDIYFQAGLEVRPLPTPTPTPGPPTATPTATVLLTPSPSPTPTMSPTATLSPTATPSPTSSPTLTQTPTATPITPTATPTLTPTLTPRLNLTPHDHPETVFAGQPITITWTVETNRGANTWIEWGPQRGEYSQRHDFPWIPGGVYDFEYTITAPSWPELYFRVGAQDDIRPPVYWSESVTISTRVYVPLLLRNYHP